MVSLQQPERRMSFPLTGVSIDELYREIWENCRLSFMFSFHSTRTSIWKRNSITLLQIANNNEIARKRVFFNLARKKFGCLRRRNVLLILSTEDDWTRRWCRGKRLIDKTLEAASNTKQFLLLLLLVVFFACQLFPLSIASLELFITIASTTERTKEP